MEGTGWVGGVWERTGGSDQYWRLHVVITVAVRGRIQRDLWLDWGDDVRSMFHSSHP